MIGRILALLAFGWFFASIARAHPVAQGAMDVTVHPGWIEIQARVSNEEAYVAEGLGGSAPSKDLEALRKRHGEYLMAHLYLRVDDVPLVGRIVAIAPPPTTLPEAHIKYTVRYELAEAESIPRKIELRQDILNEFSFAPGNPWEAIYIARVSEGDRVVREGLLLTRQTPLSVELGAGTQGATPPAQDRPAMALAFVNHGIAHILGGLDHLLFVAALVLAVRSLWDLVKVVTAFSLAHTITLTLAVLDLVRLPGRIVEPMIAASIVIVALQNVVFPARSRGGSRLIVAFGFGLFHGLGFAGGLRQSMEGMPGLAVFTAIAAFSGGVELGHQIVALPLFGAMKALRRMDEESAPPGRLSAGTVRLGSCAIGVAGGFYLLAALRWPP